MEQQAKIRTEMETEREMAKLFGDDDADLEGDAMMGTAADKRKAALRSPQKIDSEVAKLEALHARMLASPPKIPNLSDESWCSPTTPSKCKFGAMQ